jgi:hypothetical protein
MKYEDPGCRRGTSECEVDRSNATEYLRNGLALHQNGRHRRRASVSAHHLFTLITMIRNCDWASCKLLWRVGGSTKAQPGPAERSDGFLALGNGSSTRSRRATLTGDIWLDSMWIGLSEVSHPRFARIS